MALNNILQADEIGVYGILKRDGGDGKIAYAEQVYDTTQEKFQSEINKDNKDYKDTIEAHFNNTSNPHKVTKEQVGLSEVTNDAQVKRSEMGQPLGVATLDGKGKVLANQLPSFVDDVLEFEDKSVFPDVGESGKIYVALDNNLTYRWSGSTYIEISQSLAIGDTDTTAYQGSKGKKLEQDLTDEITRAKAEEAKKYIKPDGGIPKSDLSADVVADIANKGVINIGTPSADTTIVSIPVNYPTSTQNISINGASEYKAGVLVSSDKAKLNRFEEQLSSDEIKQIGSSLTQDDVTNVQFQLEKIQELYKQADDTIKGAETVDAELNGNILIVTRRDGSKQQVNLTDSDEHVTITFNAIDATKGITIFVYINNSELPQQYTSDDNSQITFTITKGSTYKIVFPGIKGYQTPFNQQYTAYTNERSISVQYIEEADLYETVTVQVVQGKNDRVPKSGVNVYVTSNNVKTTQVTDSNGYIKFRNKLNTNYTVAIDKEDGVYELTNRWSITRQSIGDSFLHVFVLDTYISGIWVIDDEENEYTYEEWVASGKDAQKLVLIKMASQESCKYDGTVYLSIDYLANYSNIPSKQWCNQVIQFPTLPLNCRDTNNIQWPKYAWNGALCTDTIIADGKKLGVDTPAATYCKSLSITCGTSKYNGYLPTSYQWEFVWNNFDIVLEYILLKYKGLSISKNNFSGQKWTSHQLNVTLAYGFSARVSSNGKSGSTYAIPFFAL